MDSEHDSPVQPELDAAVARAALARGDLSHAMHHVANALADDPLREDHVALLEALVQAAGVDEALALVPLDDRPWFGAAAVHAWLLAHRGDRTDALELLCQVAVVRPDVPYLAWAPAWVAAGPVDPDRVYRAVGRLMRLECRDGCAQARSVWGPASEVVAAVCEAHPDQADLWCLGAIAARRAGRYDQALALARRGHEAHPCWMSAVALANAHRALGQDAETEDAWRLALTYDADDLGVRLDWGDHLLDRGDWDGAAARYREVLERDPDQAWARSSLRYLDWASAPTVHGRLALLEAAEAAPDDTRLVQLAELATPWVGRLPDPGGRTVEALVRAVEEDRACDELELPELEPPSSQRALDLWAEERGRPTPTIRIVAPAPPVGRSEPEVRWVLWSWEGTRARPALAAPEPCLQEAVASLARRPFHGPTWLTRGRALAEALGPAAAEGVLGVALHPGPRPTELPPCAWLYRVQHAVAFVLAGADLDAPWGDGLWSMASAGSDWATIAACAALAERARVDPDLRDDAIRRLCTLLDDRPGPGSRAVAWAAACGLWRVGLSPASRVALEQRLLVLEE